MSAGFVWLNGALVTQVEAVVPVTDRGFTLGDGLFETMRARNGRATNLRRHLARLFSSAEMISLDIPFTSDQLRLAVTQTLQANALADAYVRLTVSRGQGGRGVGLAGVASPIVAITVRPFEPYSADLYLRGMRVKTVGLRRNPTSPLTRLKSLSYLDNILAKAEASRSGADEGLMLNTEGYVACGCVSNIFFLSGQRLITPSLETGILPGITRSLILELARDIGLRVEERLVVPEEAPEMEASFLTNTLMGVMPLTWLDGRPIGKGEVHPVVRQFGEKYEESLATA